MRDLCCSRGPKGTAGLVAPAAWWCLSLLCRGISDVLRQTLNSVQYISNTSSMTNRLFLLSGYCFRLSYLWPLRRLRDLTTGVSDAAEGPGSSVHSESFFPTSVSIARVMHSSSNDRVVSVCCRRVY